MTLAQLAIVEGFLVDVARVAVLVLLAGVLGAIVGLIHRWYANEQVPDGLTVLIGLSSVALYLNTAGALGEVIGGTGGDLLALEMVAYNTITLFLSGVTASAGGRVGDRAGISVFAVSGRKSVEQDVSRIVKSVGRVTTVEVPDDIEDIDGYEPVDSATKDKLAGQTLLFPRRLTVEELQTRFVERLRIDYDVGYVDVEFAEDASIEYLALGRRESGLGPTLPPGSAAVAVRADPPNNASPGDAVQVWTTGDGEEASPHRVTNAELRGTAEDVVTLTMDERDARRFDTERRYRLVTLPVEARTDREFAAQLRAAEETTTAVTIESGSPLVNSSVGALDIAVVAVRTSAGDIEAIPPRRRPLAPGETVYAIARPAQLRQLEAAAAVDGQ
ncbi:potassium transporter TrkA [Natronomonas gomsonensis]|jgi:hypothetical protein|uniref:potassium transporter TrkA n=1 Tax=Natronomonas gomsonensis TaxID=1046043 RepID=UPI0020CA66BC|nr:potassium transporter TrkA [Natronomonas gomsonensis]MCY4730902.1 potassium transporter TrkA [Natronomonas gomsonensis]